MKPIYLIAGSPGSRKKITPLLQAALRESGKLSPTVGYIGTANGDSTWFFRMTGRELKSAGAGSINHAILTPNKAKLSKACEILRSADIVFISGGDVAMGMEVLREKGMIDFLHQLYQQGKAFLGISAGSIMLAKEWVYWRDPDDDESAEVFACLGLAPIICDTHAEKDDWLELKALLMLEKHNVRGYGITSGAAIKYSLDGKIQALGGDIHQYIRRSKSVERLHNISP
jgi:peptidase E